MQHEVHSSKIKAISKDSNFNLIYLGNTCFWHENYYLFNQMIEFFYSVIPLLLITRTK